MLTPTFDPHNWAAVPFHFWSVVFFIFGAMVGSFLNVCIYRMPLGESIVSPPSHCPHCKYSIPWYLNIPLVTWVYLRGKCRNCGAPISARYFLVELLTAVVFLCCWWEYGPQSAGLAIVYAFFMAGLIVATFIDIEHLIIPDEITIGGMVVGFICSFFLPAMHSRTSASGGMKYSLLGMAVGAGVIYGLARAGKLWLGRQRIELPAGSRVVFTETAVVLPDETIPYEHVFYRRSDAITLQARQLELVDRCYTDATVRLTQGCLVIGEEKLKPEDVPHLEAVTDEIVLPREAMGLGDTKFMGAIGAFLGWKAVLFSIMLSSLVGSAFGVTLIALRKRDWSSPVYYGPFLALGATVWVFAGERLIEWWFSLFAWAAKLLALGFVS
jgi:leader peptidase (prepilin peptidase) / N-methyltransferase